MGGKVKKAVKKVTHAVESVGKAALNVATFGYVGQREQSKATTKAANAEAAAVEAAAKAQAEAAEKQAQAEAEAREKQAKANAEAAERQEREARIAVANTPEDQVDATASAIRDQEAKDIKKRRGMAGTVLTSALGTSGAKTSSNKLGVAG